MKMQLTGWIGPLIVGGLAEIAILAHAPALAVAVLVVLAYVVGYADPWPMLRRDR